LNPILPEYEATVTRPPCSLCEIINSQPKHTNVADVEKYFIPPRDLNITEINGLHSIQHVIPNQASISCAVVAFETWRSFLPGDFPHPQQVANSGHVTLSVGTKRGN
jgi:hypothetical protein